MTQQNTAKSIEAIANYLNTCCHPDMLAADLRKASFELSLYVMKDDEINGTNAKEMADIVYMLRDVANVLHPVE